MSDYISLEDLFEMTEGEVFGRWGRAKFPFDMAGCRHCMTYHVAVGCDEHPELTRQASAVLSSYPALSLKSNLEAIYSLRLFFKGLYPTNPPEIMEPVTVEESVHKNSEQFYFPRVDQEPCGETFWFRCEVCDGLTMDGTRICIGCLYKQMMAGETKLAQGSQR